MREAGKTSRGETATAHRVIACIGNPNSGKTTLFNALTGLRQKVGNYPGVTVEKKEGKITLPDGTAATLIDLPGTYSLSANSPDERITTDVLLGQVPHEPIPDLVIVVIDASNLERNLYLASQMLDRGLPMVIALNMIDVAHDAGMDIDDRPLTRDLGVPVIPMIANKGVGIKELKQALADTRAFTGHRRLWRLPGPIGEECDELVGLLERDHRMAEPVALHEAISLLTSPAVTQEQSHRFSADVIEHVRGDQKRLDALGYDRQSVFITSRYDWIKSVVDHSVVQHQRVGPSISDRIDRVVTHRLGGLVLFFVLMAVMFQSIFTWAAIPTAWIQEGFDALGGLVKNVMPDGDLRALIVDGGIAGVSAVVSFLPQILFLFFFLGILEDTGYMARAAFIMDRLMGKVGLHGKSFIPMLSSFACAIPGIMATRTIENPKDRIATMMVAPLMSCSARLPVYTLLIATCIPSGRWLGLFSYAGMTLLSMYLLGLVAALAMAWVFKKTLLRKAAPAFIMELPPYKLPSLRSIVIQVWEKAVSFLRKAGTIILGASVILWFLCTYPKTDDASPANRLTYSYAGQAGRLLEPVIRPLGFDWKIGIGLVSSLMQREVFVSTMGTIYNIENAKSEVSSLKTKMQHDVDPVTGKPVFSVLTGVCVMVYYVLAMQCLSTVIVLRRETNGWKWPLLQVGYMTALAYSVTFVVYRIGTALGG